MNRLEKEKMNNLSLMCVFLGFLLSIAIATFLAILSWYITNAISFLWLLSSFSVVILLGVAIVILEKNINKKIKDMKLKKMQ